MRFLFAGCGSIGSRHFRNLWRLGERDIILSDISSGRLAELRKEFGVEVFEDFDAALEQKPEVVFVSLPTHLHIPFALKAAQAGCHLFIEKPLSHTMEGVEQLLDIVRQKKLVTIVGCNMRFHHGPSTIKRLLGEGAIGRVISAFVEFGQYLPDWHPFEDYRRSYSAQRSMGGGVVFDLIHEIDYVRWFFGEVEEVFSYGGKLSNLEIDTEDCVNVLMKFENNLSAVIHLDYVQRSYARSCKVIGEEGTITWDITDGPVRFFSAQSKSWTHLDLPQSYDFGQVYIDEMQHFLLCLNKGEPAMLDVFEAKRVTEVALAVKKSMQSGQKQSC